MVTDPDGSTGTSRTWRRGELPAASNESAATTIDATARSAATSGVTVQKSAAAIVVFRYFTRVADHEGPVNGCQEPLFLGFESADLVQQV